LGLETLGVRSLLEFVHTFKSDLAIGFPRNNQGLMLIAGSDRRLSYIIFME
jgi:hypothetical protein